MYKVKGYFGHLFKCGEGGEKLIKTKTLQEKGNLSDSMCTFYTIREPELKYEIYQDAVTRGIAESEYFHKTVSRLCEGLEGRTLVLVERVAHGDALHKMIPNSIWVSGKDDLESRRYVIEQLSVSKGKVVAIATNIFNTGVSFHVHNLVNAAGGAAEHLTQQRLGRGLRKNENSLLNYYDFLFLINDYLEDHSKKRIKVIEGEQHEVVVKEIDF